MLAELSECVPTNNEIIYFVVVKSFALEKRLKKTQNTTTTDTSICIKKGNT